MSEWIVMDCWEVEKCGRERKEKKTDLTSLSIDREKRARCVRVFLRRLLERIALAIVRHDTLDRWMPLILGRLSFMLYEPGYHG